MPHFSKEFYPIFISVSPLSSVTPIPPPTCYDIVETYFCKRYRRATLPSATAADASRSASPTRRRKRSSRRLPSPCVLPLILFKLPLKMPSTTLAHYRQPALYFD